MDKHRWQRIQELFSAVEALSDQEQQAYLEQVCPDPELRNEVLSLLTANNKADAFLKPTVIPDKMSQGFASGTTIGPYQIESLLGEGGMGQVYMAQDTRLHRPVALKFLSDKFQKKPAYRQRFMVEARAASRLDHPNICTIFDIGETEQEQPYIAMAYYAGDNLDNLIKSIKKRPDMAQSIAIICQILNGVSVAHQHGIVHRDLKPANIIVTNDNVAKILDFGIAKISGIDITSTGNQVGTIAYMSPEQLQGNDTTLQVDIWSCGVILYELLTGQRPFRGKENHHVMYAILHKQYDSPQKLNPSIPDAIARIIERMLNHDLELRYPDAQSVLNDLTRLDTRFKPGNQVRQQIDTLTNTDTVDIQSNMSATSLSSDGDIRQATVMSVDLCDYSRLLQNTGADNTQRLVQEFFNRITRVVESYGGVINRIQDNTLIALFGVPRAHGNDAHRAVHAAFACHRNMFQLGKEQRQELQVHIGIANGVVLINNPGTTTTSLLSITGDSLNLATRLDDLAQAEETLISNSLYMVIKDDFECERAGQVRTRHQKEPIEVWRVISDKQQDLQNLQPIFGRHAEAQQFSQLLEQTRTSQRGQIVYVCGEAGIGKTRLAAEFKQLAQGTDFAIHQAQVLDFGVGQTQGTMTSVLRSLLYMPPALHSEPGILDTLLDNGQIENSEVIYVKELLGLDMTHEEQKLFDIMEHHARMHGLYETLSSILLRRAKEQPQLILFEDMHWADETILNGVTELATQIQNSPVILLLTTRPENEPLTPGWRTQLNNTPLVSFYLSALHEQDAEQMARALTKDEQLDLKKLIRRSQGNPLFLEQLIRSADLTSTNADSDSSILPPTLQSLVQAQLDKLEHQDRYAARAASIIGQRFSNEEVRYLINDPGYDCRKLVNHQLAHATGTLFQFNHALIHEGIYASLLDLHKQELHQRAADWFQKRDKPLAAEHLDRAGSKDAPAAYLSAALQQRTQYHFEQALRLIERALLITEHDDQLFALQLLKGDVLADMGEIATAQLAYEQALKAATADDQRCRAWIGLAQCHDISDEHEQVLQTLQKAEQAAQQHKLVTELAQIHYQRGNLYFPQGNIEACRTEHQQAIEYARQSDSPRHEAQALSGLGDAEYAAGHMLSAHEYFKRCLQLCQQYNYSRIEAANKFMLGTVRIYMNELDEALQDSLDSATTASKVGHVRAEIVSRLTAGWILIEMQKLDQALEQVETGLELTDQLGARRFAPFLNESKVRILLADNQRNEALKLAQQAIQETRNTSSLQFIGPWVLGALALASDDQQLSQAALQEANQLLEGGCVGHNYYQFYRAAIEYSLRNKHWHEAEHYAQKLKDYTQAEPNPWSELHTQWGLTLAKAGMNLQKPATADALQQLRDKCTAAGFYSRVTLIDEISEPALSE